ncbi:MAG: 23S rRNA (guanosine(2251)-2'-O)-methyltransferase RlmB [Oscillospiraceae bacterium]|nr:23S rRNA (guanosine(2251)-2'-O)-methyltransferase RlmB [Oscillospiraceae bacterium]MDD7353654.1 23S rRNA (guanosine(2251)-2'-O)-methyltransferase RlmB [Oscillospiraceae bacterium]MDY3937507.1 23S rRNA (guanosine(2251)-2'-O)-methyltransferase RlmB [Oscillospiraceae bacterium]
MIKEENEGRFDDVIIGKNAVKEALKSGRPADRLIIERGEHKNSLAPIVSMCKDMGIPVKEADGKKLDFLSGHGNHQGVILIAAAHEYASIDDIFALAEERNEKPFIIICDRLEDPHNLGAVIRSAEAAGAHGVIVPNRRSVGLNGTVGKASAGALEYVPVVRVANITSAIGELKQRGVWVYAADMDGEPYYKTDMSGSIALVIGNEGGGVSRLVKENSDAVVSIPMNGKINSLNASVAAGILMFEVAKTRNITDR